MNFASSQLYPESITYCFCQFAVGALSGRAVSHKRVLESRTLGTWEGCRYAAMSSQVLLSIEEGGGGVTNIQ